MKRFDRSGIACCVGLIVVAGSVVSGCRSEGQWGEIEEVVQFDGRTVVQQFDFKVVDGTTWTELGLNLKADSGTVTCTFTDPAGQVRWEEHVSPGASPWDAREFEPISGPWQLRLAMQDATGAYKINWSAR